MGCSPSVLLEHIHRDSSAHQDKSALKKHTTLTCANNKKEANRSVVHRKSSLALTPEDELLDIYKPSQDARYGHLLPPIRSPLMALVVYGHFDTCTDAVLKAGDKLGFDTHSCDNYESALDQIRSKSFDLIIIDTRSARLDYDTLCRSIRNTKGNHHIAMVAVVKRSVFEKDDIVVPSLLESGFTRCIAETTNRVVWENELHQLQQSDCRSLAQLSTTYALYSAIDHCRDVVFVTDDCCRIQYINTAGELYLGYHPHETLGKTIQEQFAVDPSSVNTMCTRLSKNRTFQSNLMMKRKSQEPVSLYCQALPVTCLGRSPTHFVVVLDTTSHVDMLPARGSVHSIRKPSIDVRSINSDYYRRASLAKISALPLEAPITKIANLIAQAQDVAGTNYQVVNLLDKVTDMLHVAELYSPHMKEDNKMRIEEPTATDLIGALLSSHQLNLSSRRSSNDSTIYRSTSSTKAISKLKVPAQIKESLEHALEWDFNIIRFEELTSKRPLVYLGMNLMTHYDLPYTLNCDEKILYNFLVLVESKYHSDNFYHNSTHAADVLQAVAVYMERERMKAIMDPIDEATALIAAACHDIDHPGKSSAFLCNKDDDLAVLYNDITVLESHHASLTFKLALADDRVNIFKNLDRETYKIVRNNIIDMILATEMTKHFEHLTKFVSCFATKNNPDDDTFDNSPVGLPENVSLVKRMMIKCADVSNPTRPLSLCVEWSRRITEEYFQQTDEEKQRGLPVVMPMFDRTTCSVPKAQIGFIDFIIIDMVETWNSFIDFPEIVAYMRQNYIKWKEYDEQGYTTLADVKRLQATVLAPIKSTPTVVE